jgi:hypothetical protein
LAMRPEQGEVQEPLVLQALLRDRRRLAAELNSVAVAESLVSERNPCDLGQEVPRGKRK